MNTIAHHGQCWAFLNTQVKPTQRRPAKSDTHYRSVNISREAGSGGNTIAEDIEDPLLYHAVQHRPRADRGGHRHVGPGGAERILTRRHRISGDPARGPRGLEVEATGEAVNIQ